MHLLKKACELCSGWLRIEVIGRRPTFQKAAAVENICENVRYPK